MPELPEVETFRRYIDRTSMCRLIAKIEVKHPLIIRPLQAEEVITAGEGSAFLSSYRHGKNLFLELSRGGWLTWHFGMTGEPVFFKRMNDEPRYDRLLFTFENGYLAFSDPRMLGRIGLTSSPDEYVRKKGLGPDVLMLTRKDFVKILERSKGAAKNVLMDQHKMAGVGNLYSDEALFQSGIDPRAPVQFLERADMERLYHNVRKVLRRSIERKGDLSKLPRTYLLRHRFRGGLCPNCGGDLLSMTLGGRTSFYCPRCQREDGD
ncbi:MAG: Fpg/Nei family DNA glycosylase [Methanomassiliicoccus sp.]|nr:Fpg/Nei family DNA glycosylase [Methanomassiliicoccus sp.]